MTFSPFSDPTNRSPWSRSRITSDGSAVARVVEAITTSLLAITTCRTYGDKAPLAFSSQRTGADSEGEKDSNARTKRLAQKGSLRALISRRRYDIAVIVITCRPSTRSNVPAFRGDVVDDVRSHDLPTAGLTQDCDSCPFRNVRLRSEPLPGERHRTWAHVQGSLEPPDQHGTVESVGDRKLDAVGRSKRIQRQLALG